MYFTSEMNEMPIHYFWVSLMLCLFQEYIYIYLYIHTTHCTKHLGILGRKQYRGNWEVLVSLRQIRGGTLLEKSWKHKAPVPFLIEHYWGTFLYAVPQIWGGSSGENNKHQFWLMTLCVGVNINYCNDKDCLAKFKSRMWSFLDILRSESFLLSLRE